MSVTLLFLSVSSVLCTCFYCDVPFVNENRWHNPSRADLVAVTLPTLQDLEDTEDTEPESAVLPAAADKVSVPSSAQDAVEGGNGNMATNGLKKHNLLVFKTREYY